MSPVPASDALVPKEIRKVGSEALRITWSDGVTKEYFARLLRQQCPCAACRNEFTGERRLDPNSVSEAIQIITVRPVGRYALSIFFSDNHGTGIYPFEMLKAGF